MRPRINKVQARTFGSEVYTIQYHKGISYYRRVQAILETQYIVKRSGVPLRIYLNRHPFIQFNSDGTYRYIYDASKDNVTSPELKQMFIQKRMSVAS